VGALPGKVGSQRHHAAQLTARSNVFVERLWKSIKYEEVYLHAYDSVSQAKAGLARYINFYNTERPHSSLDTQTPDEFYFATLPAIKQAA
jgi:putative transposase